VTTSPTTPRTPSSSARRQGEIAPLKLKPAQVILNEAVEKQIAANLPSASSS
jgi:hypothetical protein